MALRLIQLQVADAREEDSTESLRELLDDVSLHDVWAAVSDGGRLSAGVVAEAGAAETVVERLEDRYGDRDGFRILLLAVEATVPAPEPDEEDEEAQEEEQEPTTLSGLLGRRVARVSREELLVDVKGSLDVPPLFLIQTVLSTIVCAVGLLGDNVAVIIGAMVIAPLLGPNVALSLGATLGDVKLVRRAAVVNLAGLALALAAALGMGLLFPLDPAAREVALRTTVSVGDVVLALAVGMAGTLSFTSGVSGRLIGVMVAVALLPPLVVLGMLLGAGELAEATGAFLLLSTNIICVNLAGVATFLLHDVRPRTWYEQREARRSSRLALVGWTALLLLLLAAIYLYGLQG